jgi:hypothetical protein
MSVSRDDWNGEKNTHVHLMQKTRSLFGFLWLVLLLPSLRAQSVSTDIKRALQQAEFQIAADLADSAIVHFREYLPQDLAEIHALRALVFFDRDSVARGEEHLALALQLNPHLQLDPIFFSPQIRQRLEELRPKIAAFNNNAAAPAVRYLVVADPRLEATWRSLFLPGWGQRFKEQKTKGRIFSIAAAVLAGTAMTSHILRSRAEKRYLRAGENEVEARYETFNRYHLLRNNSALSLGVVWGAAVLDALIVPVEPRSRRVGLTWPPHHLPTAAGLSLKITF